MLKTVSISVLILIYSLNLYNLQSVAKYVNNSNIIKISQYSDIYSNNSFGKNRGKAIQKKFSCNEHCGQDE